ncbi:MAG: transposase family protein [Cytophagales bacterium]|nr:transposase family protein [Cytophagales bacterium]
MAAFMDISNDLTRSYRPINNPFEIFPTDKLDYFLKRRFRFDKEGILFLTDLIREKIECSDGRGRPLPAEVKVMVALRYFASNSHQLTVSDTFHIGQASASRCVNQCMEEWNKLLPKFINFPTNQAELQAIQHGFYSFARFPQVVGAIDGTHVKVIPERRDENDYVNRKGQHTLNCQAVCDHNGRYLNLVARWPGSTHDSFILKNSDLWDHPQ